MAAEAVQSASTGYASSQAKESITNAYNQYKETAKTNNIEPVSQEEFTAQVKAKTGEITSGFVPAAASGQGNYDGSYDEDIKVTIEKDSYSDLEYFAKPYKNNESVQQGGYNVFADEEANTALNSFVGNSPGFGQVALYGGLAYIYRDNRWRLLFDNKSNKPSDTLNTRLKRYLNAYKTGGLADFTGPAWLDGTKSRPELVLNQRDTQNFIQLKDILADIMSNPSDSKKSSGDNYYTIDINVEELKDDYDVEQLANKIRSMLHDDAMYRNVNAISHIR